MMILLKSLKNQFPETELINGVEAINTEND